MADDDPQNAPRLDAAMRVIADRIDAVLKETVAAGGPRLGFGLFIFEFPPGDALFWISNADREDAQRAFAEWLARET